MKGEINPLFTNDCDAGIYSKSMRHLQYVPTMREKVSAERCYNTEKYEQLKRKIKETELPSDDPKQRRPDISLAKEKLNWEPKIDLETGLKKTIEYFKLL